MAVKKHKLAPDSGEKFNLARLSQFLQIMSQNPKHLPTVPKLVQNCQDIVQFLAHPAGGTLEQLGQLLKRVEAFLRRVIRTIHGDARHEIFTAILDKFYFYISDPLRTSTQNAEVCPAAASALTVLDEIDEESALSAARWLVQQRENGAGQGLRTALGCLYRWLSECQGTPAVGTWLVVYITALEENERYDILIETSVDHIGPMFSTMSNTELLERKTADAMLHVLVSLRDSPEAFDRISSHVADVLVNLAGDSGQWTRQLLQNVVDVLTVMVNGILGSLKEEALVTFRVKYASVIQCLERHMASGESNLFQAPAWRTRTVNISSADTTVPCRKVGLVNLGNTCYMNSVIQALLVIRQFSNHVVLRMTAAPYWARMSILFAKMTHSISSIVDPEELLSVVVTPFFTKDTQHDSSEFLGFLFQLLQSYEHCSDRNFDYTRPPVLNGASRWRMLLTQSSTEETREVEHNRRSLSPKPGSSGSSSSGQKRPLSDHKNPAKKRLRVSEATYLRRDSFIDNMFGGVLRTRVECSVCNACSVSRDVFRDLQLSFPEKPIGRQYSVQSLLEYYCSKESLSGDNKYQCRNCGRLRDAERSVLVEIIPKYLILVLKNFKFDVKSHLQTKLMHSVYYNHTVTLPSVRPQAVQPIYNLFAAVIHSGTTLDSGHYFTIAKDEEQWHKFNDDKVTFSDETQLNGPNPSITPYILFYRRTDIEEGTAPALNELPPKLQEMVMSHNKEYVDNVRNICATRP